MYSEARRSVATCMPSKGQRSACPLLPPIAKKKARQRGSTAWWCELLEQWEQEKEQEERWRQEHKAALRETLAQLEATDSGIGVAVQRFRSAHRWHSPAREQIWARRALALEERCGCLIPSGERRGFLQIPSLCGPRRSLWADAGCFDDLPCPDEAADRRDSSQLWQQQFWCGECFLRNRTLGYWYSAEDGAEDAGLPAWERAQRQAQRQLQR